MHKNPFRHAAIVVRIANPYEAAPEYDKEVTPCAVLPVYDVYCKTWSVSICDVELSMPECLAAAQIEESAR